MTLKKTTQSLFRSAVMRRLPPADNGVISLKPQPFPAFNLSDPTPQTGCVMDNKGGAVRRQDIVLEAIEIYRFLNIGSGFFGIPGSRVYETMDSPLFA